MHRCPSICFFFFFKVVNRQISLFTLALCLSIFLTVGMVLSIVRTLRGSSATQLLSVASMGNLVYSAIETSALHSPFRVLSKVLVISGTLFKPPGVSNSPLLSAQHGLT